MAVSPKKFRVSRNKLSSFSNTDKRKRAVLSHKNWLQSSACFLLTSCFLIGASGNALAQTTSTGALYYANSGNGDHSGSLAMLDWRSSSLNSNTVVDGDVVNFPLVGCAVGNLQVTFSNVLDTSGTGTATVPGQAFRISDMATWGGAAIYQGYNGAGNGEAIYVDAISGWGFTMNWSLTVNGVTRSPDVFFLDAESTNGGGERLNATTTGDPWTVIEHVNGNNYVVNGLGTQTVEHIKTEGPSHAPLLVSMDTSQTTIYVEGYQAPAFGILLPCDYSDAPSNYPAAGHTIRNEPIPGSLGLRLHSQHPYIGSTVDSEPAVLNSTNADGDDNGTDGDDEDGVTIPSLQIGRLDTINVDVVQASSGDGFLQAWIDWNSDGDFADTVGGVSERIATDLQFTGGTSGTISIPVTPPNSYDLSANTFSRFRWAKTPGLDTSTPASDGEVEDHPVAIAFPTLTVEKTVASGTASDTDWTLTVTDGVITNAGIEGSDPVTSAAMLPGTYTLSESGPSGYAQTDLSCVDAGGNSVALAGTNSNEITIDFGDNLTCTFTNDFVPFDYSDAPTTGTSYGDASHTIVSGIQLGAAVTAEASAYDSPNADGDDDDDGVNSFQPLVTGYTEYAILPSDLTASGSGNLYAWVDFNGDGSFGATEFASTTVTGGSLDDALNFSGFGSTTASGSTIGRLRYTTDTLTAADYATAANDGEVEDYAITVSPAAPPVTNSAIPSCSFNYTQGTFTNGSRSPNLRVGDSQLHSNFAVYNGVSLDARVTFLSSTNPNTEVSGGNFSGGLFSRAQFSGGNNGTFRVDYYLAGSNTPASFSTLYRFGDVDTGERISVLNSDVNGYTLLGSSTTLTTSNDGTFLNIDGSVDSNSYIGSGGSAEDLTFLLLVQNRSSVTYRLTGSGFGFQNSSFDCDFSDAPISTTSYGDPSHPIVPNFYLGGGVTDDVSGYDDVNAAGDNDDGVSLPLFTQSVTASIPVTVTGANGYLQGWIDWDEDGAFTGANEQIATNVQDGGAGDVDGLADGTITLNVPVPVTVDSGQTFARFRWSRAQNLNSSENAEDGEVEDYQLTIAIAADFSITKTNTPGVNGEVDQTDDTLTSGQTTTYTLVATNNGPSTVTGAVVTDTPTTGLTCTGTDAVTLAGDGVPTGSFTIADLTGGGITLGTLTDGQSTTLTYSCEVN